MRLDQLGVLGGGGDGEDVFMVRPEPLFEALGLPAQQLGLKLESLRGLLEGLPALFFERADESGVDLAERRQRLLDSIVVNHRLASATFIVPRGLSVRPGMVRALIGCRVTG